MGEHVSFTLSGLFCASECQSLERVLRKVPGVLSVYVNPVNETAYIEYDPAVASRSSISARLGKMVQQKRA